MKISKLVPLPSPFSVMVSPIHVTNIVPPINTTFITIFWKPVAFDRAAPYRPFVIAIAWNIARAMVTYLVYFWMVFLPC